MPIVLGGANHKTSPLWLREKAALAGVAMFNARGRLLAREHVDEVALVSTCNRVEFYVAGADPASTRESLREFLKAEYQVEQEDLERWFYFAENAEAARHLFGVACGADSMVLGECQVTGQVQRGFEQARDEGSLGDQLTRLFEHADETTRRVRAETCFSGGPVSIGSVAVDLARAHLGSLKGRAAMILGAGEMGILTARALSANGVATILVANRTLARAQEVAHNLGGRAVDYTEISAQIEKVDVLVTSTSAPHVLIKKSMVEKVMAARPKRPLFVIDLAIPRNVDARATETNAVTLINVDGLREVAERNSRERARELDRVQAIIEQEIELFQSGPGAKPMSLMDLALG